MEEKGAVCQGSVQSQERDYSLLTRAGDIKDEVGNYVLDCK